MINAKIAHIEYCLPERIVTNKDLTKENPDWDFSLIEPKTGILSRHITTQNERASDLAVRAAEKLFEKNNIDRKSVDTLLFCTQSPDYLLPTTACVIQERLKLSTNTAALDFSLGCSGYIYGLAMGGAMINAGISKKVLLLCAETYSKYISPDDRTSRTIFGDGGTATLIELSKNVETFGPFVLGTDGKGKDKLILHRENNVASVGSNVDIDLKQRFYMDGAAVFMFTMRRVPECVTELLTKAEKKIDDIDLFVFHQASKVILDNIIRKLSLKESKVFRGYERIGNTVSACIPIALKQAEEQNRLKKGDLIMLVGYGVGYSWGGCLVRWGTKS
ncbi:MAG: ketoacyl-ACP synthase III [Candidatus Omnitrophica bacterium]|nr:ketoacyl-ACP synthase III [Candidatus Omnitrophota bacterium]